MNTSLFLVYFAFPFSLLLAWIFYLRDESIKKESMSEIIKKSLMEEIESLNKELDKKNQLITQIKKPNLRPVIKHINNVINMNDYRK
jgi:hypothetical protein